MKRLFKTVALLVLVLIIGVAWLLVATFMGRRPVVDGQQVGGIRIIADGFSSLAVIPINERQVADLVDERSGMSEGFIGLQVHGIASGAGPYEVRWRKLYIRQLPAEN